MTKDGNEARRSTPNGPSLQYVKRTEQRNGPNLRAAGKSLKRGWSEGSKKKNTWSDAFLQRWGEAETRRSQADGGPGVGYRAKDNKREKLLGKPYLRNYGGARTR